MSEYHNHLRARRSDRKARLLTALRRHEADGKTVILVNLETALDCPKSTLHRLWLELAEQGLVVAPYAAPRRAGPNGPVPEADLAARVARVRQAKIEKRIRERRNALTEAELREVLPDVEIS